MVNTEEIIKRIELLMDYYGISASVFADKIGVQRSGLSHLLSGRNKPSLDFIMKVIVNYPDVNFGWLLNGEGNFPGKQESASKDIAVAAPTPSTPNPAPKIEQPEFDLFSAGADENEKNSAGKIINPISLTQQDPTIERIVIFYKDGSFDSYTQK